MCVLDRDDVHDMDQRFHREQDDAKQYRVSHCRPRRDVFWARLLDRKSL